MTYMFKAIHYCLQMHLKTLEISVLKYTGLILLFFVCTRISMQAFLKKTTCLKKTNVKVELLEDIDMLLMVEKRIRGGICQAIHRYAKGNNKYMNNFNEDIYHHI